MVESRPIRQPASKQDNLLKAAFSLFSQAHAKFKLRHKTLFLAYEIYSQVIADSLDEVDR